ncbi:MAG: hypothetical protein BGO40_01850 [Chryseobacterium sp. 39-10]|nr:terminase small subunit [Chryseobacterium sp.]OJV48287.1 MAG: hypothetical protein BGO40_01850 [Chryseobacterium sp. 39-10]
MNHKRKLFISEYSKSGNATDAAKRAGYSARTAYSAGQRLLKNVEVLNEIKRVQNDAIQKAEITVSEVVLLTKDIAVSGKSESNRLRALDMLLKYLGAYADDLKLVSRLSDAEIDALASRLMNKIE